MNVGQVKYQDLNLKIFYGMLKHRIIPVLLTDGTGQCVKPVAFSRPYRRLGTMEQYIRVMESRNVDELIIIDITATEQKREPNFEKLRSWCDNLFCPVTYGGGISSIGHIEDALRNGADKVAIKTNWEMISDAANKFGSQAIVGVIDWFPGNYGYIDATTTAELMQEEGAGELMVTDMTLDGKMEGYNQELIYNIAQSTVIPIIACGGCSTPTDMFMAIGAGASAVASGSMFLYTDHTPLNCARALNKLGVETRV